MEQSTSQAPDANKGHEDACPGAGAPKSDGIGKGVPADHSQQAQRQRRMALLARADKNQLLQCWASLGLDPCCEMIRGPETGLIALRGRIGGGGAPFNFGEATLTRATIRLESGAVGHAAMLGRDQAKAKLAAVIDALATETDHQQAIEEKILAPIEASLLAADRKQFAQSQATKVNFFTMVRGED